MEQSRNKLSNNELSVLALANEYCRAVELASSSEPKEFVEKMVRLLPRIYMAVMDLPIDNSIEIETSDYVFGSTHLDEEYYNQVCQSIAATLGSNDTYLETFHEDMKYSETPIVATISESLADIFQVLFNFVEDVKSADIENVSDHLAMLRSDFSEYWSQTLCNVMRPLNEISCCRTYDENDEMDFV